MSQLEPSEQSLLSSTPGSIRALGRLGDTGLHSGGRPSLLSPLVQVRKSSGNTPRAHPGECFNSHVGVPQPSQADTQHRPSRHGTANTTTHYHCPQKASATGLTCLFLDINFQIASSKFPFLLGQEKRDPPGAK